ncbi:MAG: hypothetical protein JO291_05390 [Acidimicrobiia bacterium]|nr:hypothetical protein [Acidimicrobiia bacterium]
MDRLDAVAAAIAARHLGLIPGAEARRVGFTRAQVRHRVATGRWVRLTRDLYAIAGAPLTWQRAVLAACVVGPSGTVASHQSAAALWRLADPGRTPHVTVPRSASGRVTIARVHHADLDPADITRIGPIPVTRVHRTLVDLAAVATTTALEQAVDTALDGGQTSLRSIEAAIGRAQAGRGRPGVAALRTALAAWTDPIRPGSPAEARLLRHLRDWGFLDPVRQHEVRDTEGVIVARIDVAWPEARVGLEYDGRLPHGPRRVEHDERRHAAVEALGWTLHHASRADLRPGDRRLPDLLAPLRRRPAA